MSSRKRDRVAVPQTTPTCQKLLDRWHAGLRQQKEITRHVESGPPNKITAEQHVAYDALRTIAIIEGWIKE